MNMTAQTWRNRLAVGLVTALIVGATLLGVQVARGAVRWDAIALAAGLGFVVGALVGRAWRRLFRKPFCGV